MTTEHLPQMAEPRLRVGEAIADRLRALGVDTVFGIPGVHTIELYRGIGRAGLRAVTPRHEQGAGFMADGYARVTGRPGVCLLISGPGVTNAMTPIAQAYHDSVPMLVLASTPRRGDLGRGRGALHDLPDQAGLLAGITKFSETVVHADVALAALDRAWAIMLSGRQRPVHLALPLDLLEEESIGAPVPQRPAVAEAAAGLIEAAAALLEHAERPVILLGGGTVEAGEAALALATHLDAPIALTGNAKGIVASSNPLVLGAVLPFAATQELLADADVALLVGTELSEVDVIYSGSELRFRGSVIRLDIDPAQLSNGADPAIGIAGDARASLQTLLDVLQTHAVGRASRSGAERVRATRAALAWTPESEAHVPWLDALDAALPPDRVIALDSTKLAYTAHHYLAAEQPRGWLAPYGFGTLGAALPMAIGAKLGAPDRPVVAVAGDGGILFTIAELATAVDLALPIPIVVWDNGGYGEIRDSFDRAGAPRVGTETTARDLCAIGEGFGCSATQAESPAQLTAAIQRALTVAVPTVIRVRATD
jgi:thiamine pyrophosphate-dependent acetolactate synthase large subunit-like protein